MKKNFFILLALALASVSAFANKQKPTGDKVATWSSAQEYSSIFVKDDINIIIVENSSKLITLEGPGDIVDAVKLEVRKGELFISSPRRSKGNDRVTIVIPVQNLKMLTVRGSSNVTSQELLSSPKIKVRITGDGTVALKTKGKVVVDSDENHDYIYNSTSKIETSSKH